VKRYINIYLFWIISGTIFGLIWASGILGFFDTRNTRRSVHWKPITREEYHQGFINDPIMGAGLGFIVASVACIRSSRNRNTNT